MVLLGKHSRQEKVTSSVPGGKNPHLKILPDSRLLKLALRKHSAPVLPFYPPTHFLHLKKGGRWGGRHTKRWHLTRLSRNVRKFDRRRHNESVFRKSVDNWWGNLFLVSCKGRAIFQLLLKQQNASLYLGWREERILSGCLEKCPSTLNIISLPCCFLYY